MQCPIFDAAGRALEKQPAAAASGRNVSPAHIENVMTAQELSSP